MKRILYYLSFFVLPSGLYVFCFRSKWLYNLAYNYEAVPDVHKKWHSLDGKEVTLNNKITIFGFAGNDLLQHRGDYFTLNQKNIL